MKVIKQWLGLGLALALIAGMTPFASAAEKGRLMVYTSMKETLIGSLRDGFVKKYPGIKFDYYSAGAGKLMAKIAAERQSRRIATDVLWTSEVPDFYKLKSEGLLQKYKSPEAKYVVSPVIDPDYEFTPARLGTLGIAYNTSRVAKSPKTWDDLLGPEFKDSFAVANPALSGTAMVSIAMIEENLGWEYIEKLKVNGAKIGQGSGQVVDDTASGDLKACIGVDYITIDKIRKGATLGFVYPPQMLVIPSPVAIIKGTPNLKAAQLFVDFLLSVEGQSIIASNYTLPVRAHVPVLRNHGLVDQEEAVKRAMPIDYMKMIAEKQRIIERFTTIMRSK